jgi:hypothetical protein
MSFATTRKPLLTFSQHQNRAAILDIEEKLPLSAGASAKKNKRKKNKRKRTASANTQRKGRRSPAVKVVKGQLLLRVPGYSGYQRLGASQLVPFIPLKKLRQAAKRALRASGVKPARRRHHRRGQRKRHSA